MKSELLREHVYVLCLSCAVAQEVTSIPKALELMKGHETVLPGHHRFIKNRPSGTKLFWNNGPKLNEIAEAEVNDQRKVTIGDLEVK